MEKQKCQRCNGEQYIPTHQYFKFEDKKNYVCDGCYGVGLSWLNLTALKEPKPNPNPGRFYESGVITGVEESWELIDGREPTKKISLKPKLKQDFKKWF